MCISERGIVMTKTWFITGASRDSDGNGRRLRWNGETELRRRLAGSRHWTALVDTHRDAVLPIQLDVTDRDADFDAVSRAAEHFGKLDVVVNNAGYGHFGMIEELTEHEVRAQLEANFFGALWVTQAALPIMRAQRSGHIIQVSSLGGITAFPAIGAYHASKWALEGFSQSLAQEVAGFGINVTPIEPGGYTTDWVGPSAKRSRENPAYAGVREAQTRSCGPHPTHRYGCSSARRRLRSRPGTTSHAWRHGTGGNRSRSRPTGRSKLPRGGR
jgi:NAD(P)-dependent dehydrogenase (short-subunit alcohol dehydrogenase family)